MTDLPIDLTRQVTLDNVIYIEFFNKKNFPPGPWIIEPDFCKWESYGFTCLAIRDMKLGIWRGFVATTKDHKIYNKTLADLAEEEWSFILDVHGGVTVAGKLPARYSEFNKDRWWIGFECTKGEDLFPLVKFDPNDPLQSSIKESQSYKNFHFIRKETSYLAKQLMKVSQ